MNLAPSVVEEGMPMVLMSSDPPDSLLNHHPIFSEGLQKSSPLRIDGLRFPVRAWSIRMLSFPQVAVQAGELMDASGVVRSSHSWMQGLYIVGSR